MRTYLGEHHFAVADPFGMGHTPAQLGFAMNMTRGREFPSPATA